MNEHETIGLIALWWCYAFGAMAAIGLLAVVSIWTLDKLMTLFKVKRAFLYWLWCRAKGYELHDPKIVTPKGGGRISSTESP